MLARGSATANDSNDARRSRNPVIVDVRAFGEKRRESDARGGRLGPHENGPLETHRMYYAEGPLGVRLESRRGRGDAARCGGPRGLLRCRGAETYSWSCAGRPSGGVRRAVTAARHQLSSREVDASAQSSGIGVIRRRAIFESKVSHPASRAPRPVPKAGTVLHTTQRIPFESVNSRIGMLDRKAKRIPVGLGCDACH